MPLSRIIYDDEEPAGQEVPDKVLQEAIDEHMDSIAKYDAFLKETFGERRSVDFSANDTPTNVERVRLKHFNADHLHAMSAAHGAQRHELARTLTGIGVAYKVKCRVCGAEKDITDYDAW